MVGRGMTLRGHLKFWEMKILSLFRIKTEFQNDGISNGKLRKIVDE